VCQRLEQQSEIDRLNANIFIMNHSLESMVQSSLDTSIQTVDRLTTADNSSAQTEKLQSQPHILTSQSILIAELEQACSNDRARLDELKTCSEQVSFIYICSYTY